MLKGLAQTSQPPPLPLGLGVADPAWVTRTTAPWDVVLPAAPGRCRLPEGLKAPLHTLAQEMVLQSRDRHEAHVLQAAQHEPASGCDSFTLSLCGSSLQSA